MNSNHSLNKTKKAVIYCRVSTKEQVEEGNSLATQEKICKDYAFRNGYEIVHVFIEQGESAKTILRTELKKLLSFCADPKNKVDSVIAYRLDRISRNTDDYSQIRLLLKKHHVDIKSTSEQFEDTPVGKFLENTMANIAQFDNDIRTERSVNGMKEAMREGRYVWGAAFGYTNTRIAGKATIAHHTTNSVIVQKAFQEVAKNIHPIEEIRKQLQKEGLTISKAQFYNLLKNEIYVGWIKKFGERHKGLFDPIVSQELFDRVQYVLQSRSRKNFRYLTQNPDFPLRRFIYQPDGKKLTGAWAQGRKSRHAYYRFTLNNLYFKKDDMEGAFKQCLDYYSLDQAHYSKFAKYLNQNYIKKIGDKQKQIADVENHIMNLNDKKKTLIDKNFTGVISDQTLKEQLSIIEKEVSDNQILLSEIPYSSKSIESLLSIAELFLKDASKIWEKAPLLSKLQLQWFVFPAGVQFENMILRTTEICSLYKLKEVVFPSKSCLVPLSVQTTNGGQQSHKGQKSYYLEIPQIKISNQETETLLSNVVKELELLKKTIEEPP